MVAVDKEHQRDGTDLKLLSYIAIARMCLRDVYTRQGRHTRVYDAWISLSSSLNSVDNKSRDESFVSFVIFVWDKKPARQAKHERSKCKDSCNFVSSVGETPPYHLRSRFTTAAIIFARKYSVLSIQLFRPLCSSSYEQGMGERNVHRLCEQGVPKQNPILPNQCHETRRWFSLIVQR